MTSSSTKNNTTWSFPFSQQAWDQTPFAVQDHMLTLQTQLHELQQQVDLLQGRVDKTSRNSSKPPSSDSPFNKPKRRQSSGKRGAKKGHPGVGPTLLEPTDVQHVYPASCVCGHGELGVSTPYHTHQVIELPPIAIEISHLLLHQAHCGGGGQLLKAEVPSPYATGYGPRLTALIGDLTGIHGTSRRLIQDFASRSCTCPSASERCKR